MAFDSFILFYCATCYNAFVNKQHLKTLCTGKERRPVVSISVKSKKYKGGEPMTGVAVIGTGVISESHIEAYLAFQDRCRIIALCDLVPQKAEALKEKLK